MQKAPGWTPAISRARKTPWGKCAELLPPRVDYTELDGPGDSSFLVPQRGHLKREAKVPWKHNGIAHSALLVALLEGHVRSPRKLFTLQSHNWPTLNTDERANRPADKEQQSYSRTRNKAANRTFFDCFHYTTTTNAILVQGIVDTRYTSGVYASRDSRRSLGKDYLSAHAWKHGSRCFRR